MMLRSVLNGRFRQLPGKKGLDPMRRDGGFAGSVPSPTAGRATADVSRFTEQRSGLPQGSERQIDNHVHGHIIGDTSDKGQDATLRVEI